MLLQRATRDTDYRVDVEWRQSPRRKHSHDWNNALKQGRTDLWPMCITVWVCVTLVLQLLDLCKTSCVAGRRSMPPPPASGDLKSHAGHVSAWWPRSFTFDVTAHVGDAGHGTPSVYQVWSLLAFQFWRYGAFSVSALIGLVTLTFDLLTSGHWLLSCQFWARCALPFST